MRRSVPLIILIIAALAIAGCAFINIPLTREEGPLVERVVEGTGKKKVLLVDVSGLITDREKRRGLAGRRPPMTARIREELLQAKADPLVAGVILRINTPGGTVAASDTIYHEVMEFRKRSGKPVYASITGMGTSGGYYVACAADKVHAHPTAVTGSIGVIAVQMNFEGLMAKLGIEDKTYKTGRLKALMSPFRGATPEEKKIIQSLLEGFHERFVDVVSAARKDRLNREQVAALADGRPYSSPDASSQGLIDAVSYLPETIEGMKQDLGLTEARVIRYLRPGAYGGSIYSIKDSNVTVLSLEDAFISGMEGPAFMYVWPGP